MALADVLITGATMLYSNVGAALPNINTVAFNSYGSWTGWTSLGVTTSPVRMRHDKEYYQLDAQQYAHPVLMRQVGKRTTVRFEIAEISGATLALLLDGFLGTTAPGAGVKGAWTIDWGSNLVTNERQWGFEGFRPDSAGTLQPIRAFFYKAVLMLDGDFDFNKRDSTKARATLMCMADTTKGQSADVGRIQIVTAPATS